MRFSSVIAASALVTLSIATETLEEIETVYSNHTTQVTITSCANNACSTTVNAVSLSLATTTINGVKTVYTTYCPLTDVSETVAPSSAPLSTLAPVSSVAPSSSAPAPAPAPAPSSLAAAPAPAPAAASSAEEDQYVDVTITPTVLSTTNVAATEIAQSTLFTSQLNSTLADISTYQGGAQRAAVGFAAVAGFAAALL
ncbi:uncharacterized protein LODBEIA_P13310 [Lodderomyces beijingensis]|uniref:Uncharacterized protein n=1 Tax=Lodderomyces beijingensis TaxID=1775926 RepID=A0ABP0ZG14_9ASCO